MIRVYADMVADLFHYGHVEFLRQISALGDYVLVGINADEVAKAHKRRPVQTMEERIESVAACLYVDEVIPNAPWVFDATWIEKYDIDLVAHGDDYSDEQCRYHYKAPIEMGESPRVCRRLHFLRGWSNENKQKIFPDRAGASSSIGI